MDKKFFCKPRIKEFFRYAIVGGISFIADYGAIILFQEIIFRQKTSLHLYISTAIGFLFGLLVSYILALVFVFRAEDNERDGKSFKDFLVFALVGLSGLAITECLMYIGVDVMKLDYRLMKIIAAGIVLFWNYFGRKRLIFNKIVVKK